MFISIIYPLTEKATQTDCFWVSRSVITPIMPVTFVLTLQRCKVTVLYLLYRELHCLKLTRDYVTTLTNYKGCFMTTKVS